LKPEFIDFEAGSRRVRPVGSHLSRCMLVFRGGKGRGNHAWNLAGRSLAGRINLRRVFVVTLLLSGFVSLSRHVKAAFAFP